MRWTQSKSNFSARRPPLSPANALRTRPGAQGKGIPQQHLAVRLKFAGNLPSGPGVSQVLTASPEANAEMPTIYTDTDALLVNLHPRGAGTISGIGN